MHARPHSLARPVLAASACLALAASAEAQVRIMNYNVAKLAGNLTALRGVLEAAGDDDRPGFATAPAVFCFQEVRAADRPALEGIVDAAFPGFSYATATYTTSGTEDGAGGAQCLMYRTDLLSEIPSGHVDLATGGSRNSDRWLLALNGYSSPAARFYVYSSHLKASNTAADAAERNAGAVALRNSANALGAGQHVVFCGDYNLYASTEAAYQTMIAAGSAQAVDPLGNANWNTAAGAIKHTQSPRDVSGTLVGGGVDDRFDFQFSTAKFHDADGLAIVAGSCRTLGNDGQHYNLAINAGSNAYYPGDAARSNALADLLFAASDHMPVLVDYQVPPVLSASAPASFGTAIVGAEVAVPVQVSNAAAVVHPLGADALVATVAGSSGLVGSQAVNAPLLPAAATAHLWVDTAAPGARSGVATVSSSVEGTQNPVATRTVTGTVLAHARPSWSPKAQQSARTLDVDAVANTGLQAISAEVHNVGFGPLQARLDVDGATGLVAPFAVVDAVEPNVGASPGTVRFSFDTTARAPGVYLATASLAVSDENLPGALSGALSLAIRVTVAGGGVPADLDGSGLVDAGDLAILLSQWGGAGTADLDHDGAVGAGDLAILLGSWG